MKILHIINTLSPAGAEKLLLDITPIFMQMGHTVEILTIYKYDNKYIYQKLNGLGVRIFELNKKFRYDFRIPFLLFFHVLINRYDIIHAHLFPSLYWAILCKNLCKKIICTEHSSYNQRHKPQFRGIEKFIYNQFHSIVCISVCVKNSLDNWLPCISNKTVVVSNGVSLNQFIEATKYSKADFNIPESTFCAITVSRIDKPQKDPFTIIKALQTIPEIHLLIVGTGNSENELKNLVCNLDLCDRVHFLGFRSDVPRLLKTCDLFIHSSVFEGFGLVLVEAMACGLPCIVSAFDGADEIIQVEKTGLIFPMGDSNALSQLVNYLIINKEKRIAMGINGVECAKKYSIEKMADNLVNLYKANNNKIL